MAKITKILFHKKTFENLWNKKPNKTFYKQQRKTVGQSAVAINIQVLPTLKNSLLFTISLFSKRAVFVPDKRIRLIFVCIQKLSFASHAPFVAIYSICKKFSQQKKCAKLIA
jgi:hypothetical protein